MSILWVMLLYASFFSARLVQSFGTAIWGFVVGIVDPRRYPLIVMGVCLAIVIVFIRLLMVLLRMLSPESPVPAL
jgi:hypothetical protein